MNKELQTTLQPASSRFLQTCLSQSWGGLEMVAFELAKALHKKNQFIVMVGEANSPLHNYCLKENIIFECLPAKSSSLKKIFALKKIIEKYKINKIIEQKLPSLKYSVPAALLVKNKIIFYGFSHIMINVNKKDLFHRFLYNKLKYVFALTHKHAQRLLECLPLTQEQMVIIPNWISLDKINLSLSTQPKNSFPNFTAFMTSRLDPQKGQDLAIKAIKILKDKNFHIDLIIAGENTLNERDFKSEMQTLVENLNLQNQIKFIGYQENLSKWYSQVDVLLVPSHEETFGRVIIEAMAMGLPSIASRAGGVPDIITHKVSGLLFETKNENDLALQLEEIYLNKDLRNQLSLQCLQEAQKYDQTVILEKLLSYLN